MSQSEPVTTFGPPVPELPVADVERAQQHYRDALGFKIGWLSGDVGAVSRGNTAIFFRRRGESFEPAVHWMFAADIDATYSELRSLGARIVESLRRSHGAYVNSLSRTSMEIASTSPATDASKNTGACTSVRRGSSRTSAGPARDHPSWTNGSTTSDAVFN